MYIYIHINIINVYGWDVRVVHTGTRVTKNAPRGPVVGRSSWALLQPTAPRLSPSPFLVRVLQKKERENFAYRKARGKELSFDFPVPSAKIYISVFPCSRKRPNAGAILTIYRFLSPGFGPSSLSPVGCLGHHFIRPKRVQSARL